MTECFTKETSYAKTQGIESEEIKFTSPGLGHPLLVKERGWGVRFCIAKNF